MVQWVYKINTQAMIAKVKLYDKIKQLLELYPSLRDSDKRLCWHLWKVGGYISLNSMSEDEFFNAPSPSSISRARRKVQENHPSLKSSKEIQRRKDKIAKTKGMFSYHERIKDGKSNNTTATLFSLL